MGIHGFHNNISYTNNFGFQKNIFSLELIGIDGAV
jgi:hypothetical protein